jgi:hypothetical protein
MSDCFDHEFEAYERMYNGEDDNEFYSCNQRKSFFINYISIEKETEKALCVQFKNTDDCTLNIWIPKSLCKLINTRQGNFIEVKKIFFKDKHYSIEAIDNTNIIFFNEKTEILYNDIAYWFEKNIFVKIEDYNNKTYIFTISYYNNYNIVEEKIRRDKLYIPKIIKDDKIFKSHFVNYDGEIIFV